MQVRTPASDNYISAKQITNFASVIPSITLLQARSESVQILFSARCDVHFTLCTREVAPTPAE